MLTTLVEEWNGMTADEKKRMLAAIFDSVTATSEGVDRLEPFEDWRPYIVAAIPKPVTRAGRPLRVLAERKTGLYVRNVETTRFVRDERGWLRLATE